MEARHYVGIGILIVFALIGIKACDVVMHWSDRAVEVAQQETDPGEQLRRYRWFKDASAALDKKRADMLVYEKRFADLKAEYGDQPRAKWAREDREQWNVWQSEVAGIKASYNGLAAEYNSKMADIGYAYTNIGQVPKGVDETGKPFGVLPRDYKPYETQ